MADGVAAKAEGWPDGTLDRGTEPEAWVMATATRVAARIREGAK